MALVARLSFLLALVVVPALVYATGSHLPDPVATHFGPSGAANGYMPRGAYIVFMLAMTVLLPLLVAATTGFIPALAALQLKSRREYWMAPARRAQTLEWLGTQGAWIGVALVLLMGTLHALIVRANALAPPHLDATPFFVVVGGFMALVLALVVRGALRFRTPR